MSLFRFQLAAALLLLLAPALRAGSFSFMEWTNDATTGLAPAQTLWACHFGATTTATINGVTVTGLAGPTAANANFDLTGSNMAVFNNDTNNLTTLAGTGSAVMARDFVSSNASGGVEQVNVKGLAVGATYVVSLFSVGFEAQGSRPLTFVSGADSLFLDQDQLGDNNGIRVDYTFTAAAATKLITISPLSDGFRFHLYGLALRTRFVVNSTADTGVGSLRQAVADAALNSGADIIIFDPGLTGPINLASEIIISDPAGVTLDASPITGGVTISGNNAKRLFTVNSGQTVTLKNLILTGGNGTGAASSGNGGAIYNAGSLTLADCTLTANSVPTGVGGAVLTTGATATLTLNRCVISANSSPGGSSGALFADASVTVNATDCRFTGNSTGSTPGSAAGAVFLFNSAGGTFTRCTFSGNSSPDGGAVRSFATPLLFKQCTFSGNSATIRGGGIYSSSTGTLTLQQCTLSGNSATLGGAIFNGDTFNGGPLTVTQCTLSRNFASNNGGGGINNEPYVSLTVNNSIVAGNLPSTGMIGADILTSDILFTGMNLAQDVINSGQRQGTSSVSNAAPMLAPLDNYGGPTQTMALLLYSPARDAAVGSTITSDQRGFPIVARADIGAYEAGIGNTTGNYNAWAWENLPAAATAPEHAAAFDYDKDGRSNLLEYGTLTDPGTPSSGSIPAVTLNVSRTQATVTFQVRLNAADLNYTLQRSPDLVSTHWTTVATYNGATNQSSVVGPATASIDGSGNITVTDPAVNGQARMFYQVLIGSQ